MDFKLGKNSGDSQHQEAPGEKKKQNTLLVLLLILAGGFTYIYFFTGLIKPQETQKTAEAPAPAPEIVKMPLPSRQGESAKPGGKAPGKAEAPKAVATDQEEAAAPVAKSVAKPVAKSVEAPAKPAPAVKSAPVSAIPKEEPKKVEAAKPADKKPQPSPVADKKVDKAAVTKAKAKKPAAVAKKPAVADKKAAAGQWSLVVGNYVLEEALSADIGRVRKAGFEPIVKPSTRKKTTMNRLFVSESNDRAAALSTLEKLKRLTSDAFVIEKGGKFVVYAGSYLQGEAANSEKERLKEAGFTTVIKHADIAIPSQSLSVGPFSNKKAADSARGKLNSAGIKATLAQR